MIVEQLVVGEAVISGSYTLTVKRDPWNPHWDVVVPLTREIAELYALAKVCSRNGKVVARVRLTTRVPRTDAQLGEFVEFV